MSTPQPDSRECQAKAWEHQKKANSHRLAKNFEEALKEFKQAKRWYKLANADYDTAQMYESMALTCQKFDLAKASAYFGKRAKVLEEAQQFGMAARACKEAATCMERVGDIEKAVASMLHAVDLFELTNSPSNAGQARETAARLLTRLGRYEEAAGLLEDCVKTMAQKDLTKYSCIVWLLHAFYLRFLSGKDATALGEIFKEYLILYSDWEGTMWHATAEILLEAVRDPTNGNIEKITNLLSEHGPEMSEWRPLLQARLQELAGKNAPKNSI